MPSDNMLNDERDKNPASGQADDQLGEQLGDTADSVTRELRDLQDELIPSSQAGVPPVEARPEPPAAAAPDYGDVARPASGEPLPPLAPVSTPAAEGVYRAAETRPGVPTGTTDDDRLLSMLSWLSMAVLSLPIVPLILLLSENTKNRSFQRHHAVTGLLFYAAAVVYELIAGTVFGILLSVPLVNLATCLCLWVIFFVPHAIALYYAFKAYGGKRIDLPYLTAFGRQQGWL